MTEIEKKEQGTQDNSNKGIQQETVSELDRADQIAERQKRENDRREELLKREENLEARRRVGGQSGVGQLENKPKEESPSEYTKRVMSGDLNG